MHSAWNVSVGLKFRNYLTCQNLQQVARFQSYIIIFYPVCNFFLQSENVKLYVSTKIIEFPTFSARHFVCGNSIIQSMISTTDECSCSLLSILLFGDVVVYLISKYIQATLKIKMNISQLVFIWNAMKAFLWQHSESSKLVISERPTR